MRTISRQGLLCNLATTRKNRYLYVSSFRMLTTSGDRVRVNFILDSLAPVLRDEFDVKENEKNLKHLIQRVGSAARCSTTEGLAASPKIEQTGPSMEATHEGEAMKGNPGKPRAPPMVEIRVLAEWVHPVSWKCPRCGGEWVARPVDRVKPQTRELTSCPRCQAVHAAHAASSVARFMRNFENSKKISPDNKWVDADPSTSERDSNLKDQAESNSFSSSPLLIEQYFMIASQWDYERNSLFQNCVLQPLQQVTTSSSMVVWFKCSLCAGSWRESISSRIMRYEDSLKRRRSNERDEVIPLCPSCEQRGAARYLQNKPPHRSAMGGNEKKTRDANALPMRFLSQDMLLMGEVCLRPDQDPSMIPLISEQVFSWCCRYCGYRYQSSLRNRVACHEGCPQCSGRVCTPMNSLTIQRPDVVREVAKTISRTKLMKLTVFSEQEIPFVCRTCFSPYRMTAKARCTIPKNGIACQKCFLNFSQTTQSTMKDRSLSHKLTAKERRKIRDKAHRLCLSLRSKEKLQATRNEIEKRDRILIN